MRAVDNTVIAGEPDEAPALREAPTQRLALSMQPSSRYTDWLLRTIALLEIAAEQLFQGEPIAHSALVDAASLLRREISRQAPEQASDGRGRLSVRQAYKVRSHIDAHLAEPILVADLCALIQRSEAHFSRSFKRTFGESPHAFLVRRRLKRAEQYMLETSAPLSEIALRCGFTDQAHLCKHFRRRTGRTPAAWRRARHASLAIKA
jgi:AraC family transcriptional regulator